MNRYSALLLSSLLILVAACKKEVNHPRPGSVSAVSSLPGASGNASGSSSDGSKKSTGFLNSVLTGVAWRLAAGSSDSILVTFTQPAPAGEWTLNIQTSDPALQMPAAFPVPEGATFVYVPVSGAPVTDAILVTFSVTLFSQTMTNTIKVFPQTAIFPPPDLKSPSKGARIKAGTLIKFSWTSNDNAWFNQLQISNDEAFTLPAIDILLDDPFWAASISVGSGIRYWRVRYVDASGNPGPWSKVRSFELRPQ